MCNLGFLLCLSNREVVNVGMMWLYFCREGWEMPTQRESQYAKGFLLCILLLIALPDPQGITTDWAEPQPSGLPIYVTHIRIDEVKR